MSQHQAGQRYPLVIVYACERCTELLSFLTACGVPYMLIDIEKDLEASMLVIEATQGQFLMPIVQIGTELYCLPTPAELAARLGIEQL